MKETCRARTLTNVEIHELDLMTDDLPGQGYDFSWSRWVAAFVSDPGLLIQKIAGALKPHGVAVLHEYAAYASWRFAPPRPGQEKFREHVIETWRASGGEPDIGLELPALLAQHGMVVRSATPHIFCLRPDDYMWQWPAVFIDIHLQRLRELGHVDDAFVTQVLAELAEAEKSPNSLMLTPLVLEIIAEKA
jgi:SAM-dependent methyltransferase